MAQILVVDDEMGIRELLSEILADEGHTAILAENAAAARRIRAESRPDLVLLDIWMPDTDGISLLKEWSSAGLLTMPVVMMSGHGTIDSAVEATRVGAIDFLEKPITKDRVFGTLDDIVALKRPRVGKNIMLETDKGVHVISSGEILYAERMARKILVVTGEAQFLAKATLAGLYDELNSMGFVYCHRGCLVNLEQIVEIEGNRLVFPDGRGCEIARQRIKDVRTAWIECMRDRQG